MSAKAEGLQPEGVEKVVEQILKEDMGIDDVEGVDMYVNGELLRVERDSGGFFRGGKIRVSFEGSSSSEA